MIHFEIREVQITSKKAICVACGSDKIAVMPLVNPDNTRDFIVACTNRKCLKTEVITQKEYEAALNNAKKLDPAQKEPDKIVQK